MKKEMFYSGKILYSKVSGKKCKIHATEFANPFPDIVSIQWVEQKDGKEVEGAVETVLLTSLTDKPKAE